MKLTYLLMFIALSFMVVNGHSSHKDKKLLGVKRQHDRQKSNHLSQFKRKQGMSGHPIPPLKSQEGKKQVKNLTSKDVHHSYFKIKNHHHSVKKVLPNKTKKENNYISKESKVWLPEKIHSKSEIRKKIYKTVNRAASKIKQIMERDYKPSKHGKKGHNKRNSHEKNRKKNKTQDRYGNET